MDQYEMIRTACRVYGQSISEMARLTRNIPPRQKLLLRIQSAKPPRRFSCFIKGRGVLDFKKSA